MKLYVSALGLELINGNVFVNRDTVEDVFIKDRSNGSDRDAYHLMDWIETSRSKKCQSTDNSYGKMLIEEIYKSIDDAPNGVYLEIEIPENRVIWVNPDAYKKGPSKMEYKGLFDKPHPKPLLWEFDFKRVTGTHIVNRKENK